jgi:hypothetical protein
MSAFAGPGWMVDCRRVPRLGLPEDALDQAWDEVVDVELRWETMGEGGWLADVGHRQRVYREGRQVFRSNLHTEDLSTAVDI